MLGVPCGLQGLATSILHEVQMMPYEAKVIILATLKCVAHTDAVDGSEQLAPAGVLDCSTMVAMDVAGRPLLLETMGARPADDPWGCRHFKNRSYQPLDRLESPKGESVSHLATPIGNQRQLVGWRLGLDLASLGIGVSTVFPIDLSTDPVVRRFFHEIVRK